MSEPARKPSDVYRYTSIARPVDPRYSTNRALLILLPLLALASAGLGVFIELDRGAVSLALGTLLAGFAAWALTRELAPDDDAAAFVALALSWPAYLFFRTGSVLLPFVALFLVRIVNRSTGVPARMLDTVAILGFCIWAAISLEQNLILLIAAAAFSLNATLREPQHYQFLAAAVCLGVFGWLLADGASLVSGYLTARDWSIVAIVAAAILLVIRENGEPHSVCDAHAQPLDASRVNAGLAIGFLLAVQALVTDGRAAWLETPIWACLIAVPVSMLARRLLRLVA